MFSPLLSQISFTFLLDFAFQTLLTLDSVTRLLWVRGILNTEIACV